MTDPPRISVVVPTYNRLDTLRHVIPSLLAQDLRARRVRGGRRRLELTDGTAEYLAGVAREHPFVRHCRARTPAALRRATPASRAARAPHRAVHRRRHHRVARPARRGTSRTTSAPATRAVVGMEVQVDSYDEYVRKRDDRAQRAPLHGEKPKRLSWLYFLTGNASAPRAELDRVGRFDEDFTGYGHEDLELGYRLQHAGDPDRVRAARGELPLASGAVGRAAAEVRARRQIDRALLPQASRVRRATAAGDDAACRSRCTTSSTASRRSKRGSSAAPRSPGSRARSRTSITTSPGSRRRCVDSPFARVSCGALTAADVGRAVELDGWVHRRRDHGGLIFIDVRDRDGITQVIVRSVDGATCSRAPRRCAARTSCACAAPCAAARPGPRTRSSRPARSRSRPPSSRSSTVRDAAVRRSPSDEEPAEDVRLRYRYLDLRRPRMQRNLTVRHRIIKAIRDYFDEHGFLEIETPNLIKSTPEGARDYLVPVARPPRHVLRAAAVAADPQADPDDRRDRALHADRALLPRRGSARRPPAGVHPARRRDDRSCSKTTSSR